MKNSTQRHVPRVLLVEDDPPIAEGIVRGLRAGGFDVELVQNGRLGAERALSESFDLIVLDLMLPESDGFAALEVWRTRISTPIIVVTALTDLDARLRVLGGGAVDYLAKPFWIEELVARIRIRLCHFDPPPARTIAWDDAVLDLDARVVTVANAPVALTSYEFNVLACLVERPDRTISRQQLAETALSMDADTCQRTVDSHIARIRKKLGDLAGSRIVTVWGIGYRFDSRGTR
ncbi:MAG TPA: response regulator transcription factor [Polyangium sp.]|nr:response regulator transcription factor [Polyangium sp.]